MSLSTYSSAAGWPCYKADAARSGVTAEKLTFPLSRAWVYQPAKPPSPAWPEPGREMHRIDFDYAFQPVMVDGLVYFGSSADDTVRALDATTGKVKWRFTAAGPIRFAPHIADSKCYIADDDGFVYCLEAATGKLEWKFRAAPEDRHVIGNGRMISRWPCRNGVLVVDGVAYVTAGMWPSEGIYVYALDARTGKQLWCNGTSGCMYMAYPHGTAYALGGVAPQGYLLASKNVLVVPTGRFVPAGFDCRTGQLLYCHGGADRHNGGSWATIAGDIFFNPRHIWVPDASIRLGEAGPQSGDGMLAHSLTSGKHLWGLNDRHRVLFDGRTLYAIGNGKVGAIEFKGWKSQQRKWTAEHPRTYCVALAGDTLLLGGADTITAISIANGKQTWRTEVEGQVRGLAIANGRLVATTEKGTIICFASGNADATTPSAGRATSTRKAGAPLKPGTATEIVKLIQRSNITRGFVLVIGQKDARLAEAIASRTQLHVISALRDESIAAAERERLLDTTDLYGSRVSVHHLQDLTRLPYAQYFANAVVVSGKVSDMSGSELYRLLRPCGGLMCFVGIDRASAEKLIKQANVGQAEVKPTGNLLTLVRGKLPDAFDWDSKVTSDHRVKWPLELLWFGGPGPDRMVSRHWRAKTPIAANGRYFAMGQYHVIAVDAYNGCELWAREIGSIFGCGIPMAADDDSVYLNFKDLSMELDAQTGKLKKMYGQLKPSERFSLAKKQTFDLKVDDKRSGTVLLRKTKAVLELTLITKVPKVIETDWWDLFFDFRPVSERSAFYGPGAFQVNVVPAPNPRETAASWQPGLGPVHPKPVLTRKDVPGGTCVVFELGWDQVRRLTGSMPKDFTFAVTLNLHNKRPKPSRTYRIADAKAHKFADGDASIANNGWATFVLDSPESSPKSSKVPYGELGKLEDLPTHARGWGRLPKREQDPKLLSRIRPLTGGTGNRIYRRAYGCCGVISSATMDFFRSGTVGFYDLADDSGMRNFAAIKPGCGITIIPALGLLLSSEGSSSCTCSYNFQTSFALAPAARRRNEDWAVFYDEPQQGFIQQAALNLGAPGDRRDDTGVLWLGIPRPQSNLNVPLQKRTDLDVPFSFIVAEGFGPYRFNADRVTIARADRPWIYASGLRGLQLATLHMECLSASAVSLQIDRPPKIDGRHGEPCWDGDKMISIDYGKASILLKHDEDKLEFGDHIVPGRGVKSSVLLRHDEDNLYVAYKRPAVIDRRGGVTPWKMTAKGNDAPVWRDDSFELYISDADTIKCLHLGVSASGARYDALWTCAKPGPFPVFNIPRLDGIVIDGKTDDWSDRGFHVRSLVSLQGQMRLPDNFDPSFRLGWNDSGLVLLVRVCDDAITETDKAVELWRADSIQLFMSLSCGSKEVFEVGISTGADPGYPKVHTYFRDRRKTTAAEELKAEVAARKTVDGYVVEVLLPWKNLAITPSVGKEIGLQIFNNDADRPYDKSIFQTAWHPLGHGLHNPNALHRVRLALKPSAPVQFKRGEVADDKGLFRAVPPYPYLWKRSLGKYDEDSKWDGTWSSAVHADENAFTAELAIPWQNLTTAGLKKDKVLVDLKSHGELRTRPTVHRGFEPLALRGEKTPASRFTVRLHFAELDGAEAGQRVFDVKLQDKVVLKNFDVVKAAGVGNRAVVKEFKGITARSVITMELIPKDRKLTRLTAPILSGIEVLMTK